MRASPISYPKRSDMVVVTWIFPPCLESGRDRYFYAKIKTYWQNSLSTKGKLKFNLGKAGGRILSEIRPDVHC
jgi:hypothetical protein